MNFGGQVKIAKYLQYVVICTTTKCLLLLCVHRVLNDECSSIQFVKEYLFDLVPIRCSPLRYNALVQCFYIV